MRAVWAGSSARFETMIITQRKDMTWIVAQLGARMHYAVPRILHAAGVLEHFFTDICAVKGWLRLLRLIHPALCPAGVARLLGRVPEGVPPSRITAFTNLGLEYTRRLRAAKLPCEATAVFLWNDSKFCHRVNASPWGNARGVFTFNNAALEILQMARARGLKAVMEQTIAPREVERRLLHEQQALHPGWQEPPRTDGLLAQYCERQYAEWKMADLIICGSDFVRDGIRECHGPMEKCLVVPYGVDLRTPKDEGENHNVEGIPDQLELFQPSSPSALRADRSGRRLHVLTVGTIGLRKGAPAVYDAAKILQGRAQFRWVGGIDLLPEAAQRMRVHVDLMGSVPRAEVDAHFDWADVFLLPSLCEGSATVTYEALSRGLPVICTPNTGSVVRDSIDGFIVPVDDAIAIVERLELLVADTDRIERMSESARRRARQFTVAVYSQRLLKALAGILCAE